MANILYYNDRARFNNLENMKKDEKIWKKMKKIWNRLRTDMDNMFYYNDRGLVI